MNIRKHLKRLFLVSTAIFWTSCSDDSQSSNPVAEPEANNSSVAAQCHEAEKVVKRKFNTDIMNDPVAYATKSAESGAQITIRESKNFRQRTGLPKKNARHTRNPGLSIWRS